MEYRNDPPLMGEYGTIGGGGGVVFVPV